MISVYCVRGYHACQPLHQDIEAYYFDVLADGLAFLEQTNVPGFWTLEQLDAETLAKMLNGCVVRHVLRERTNVAGEVGIVSLPSRTLPNRLRRE